MVAAAADLDGAAEAHAALQLVGDVLGNQLGVQFRLLDFFDVNASRVRRKSFR